VHRKILWQLQIAYLETFRRFIYLLRKAQFIGYCASIIFLLRISQILCTANWQIISRLEIVYIIVYCAEKNCRTTSNLLFGNISTIYMASAQSPIFWLLRIYHLPTEHLPVIYIVQIDQLFHHCEWSNYLIIVHRKIVWQHKIAYLEIFRQFILLLPKRNFLATPHHTIILLLRISQIFVYSKSTNYFNTGNLPHIWLLCVEILYGNFKSPIWKYIKDLYGYCAKPIFRLMRIYLFATAHLPIIYVLHIDKLFHDWKSST